MTAVVAVVVVGSFSGALAIPLGIFLGLDPVVVYVLTVCTATLVCWLLLLGGERVRTSISDRIGHGEHTHNRTRALMDRYGSVGLGLLGPLFPGVVTSSISGVVVGVEPKHLGRWLTAGIAWWFACFSTFWWLVDRTFFA